MAINSSEPAAQVRVLILPVALALLAVSSCHKPVKENDDHGPVADFTLTERSGAKIRTADLHGKVWIACFIFTRCTGECPQVTGTMARLQAELDLADADALRLVSFSVDPERDDPEELKRYAEKFQAHPQRWQFLTGKKDDIHRLCRESFHLSVEEKPKDDPTPGDPFAHSSKLVLVDRRGHIRGYYDGLPSSHRAEDHAAFEKNLKHLQEKVAALLKERP